MAGVAPGVRRGPSVLVVDDEPLIASWLADVLDDLGYFCCGAAAEAEAAIAVAGSEAPDLALLDIGLRGTMDGVALAHELRERFGVGVIFLTGASDAATRERAERASPLGFLTKPCREADLEAVLAAAVAEVGPDPTCGPAGDASSTQS